MPEIQSDVYIQQLDVRQAHCHVNVRTDADIGRHQGGVLSVTLAWEHVCTHVNSLMTDRNVGGNQSSLLCVAGAAAIPSTIAAAITTAIATSATSTVTGVVITGVAIPAIAGAPIRTVKRLTCRSAIASGSRSAATGTRSCAAGVARARGAAATIGIVAAASTATATITAIVSLIADGTVGRLGTGSPTTVHVSAPSGTAGLRAAGATGDVRLVTWPITIIAAVMPVTPVGPIIIMSTMMSVVSARMRVLVTLRLGHFSLSLGLVWIPRRMMCLR
jgi:hypothetical protein